MRALPISLGAVLVSILALPGLAEAAPSAPGCAEGPQRSGTTIVGTPCDDTIRAPAGVALVEGGGGDDTIVAAPISAASAPCPAGCHLGIGSQTFDGGPGDDVVFGERGNDRLEGGEGNDQLFGGIGDDLLRGGPGNDRLAGGFGADSIDGQAGDDYAHGDGTVDTIVDSGGGSDTLGYATGVTPGFPNGNATNGYPDFGSYPGVPAVGAERGVYLNLGTDDGDNGVAPFGGGVDEVEGSDFETIVGTPFADFIVGTGASQTVYGGGGGDVILGEGGADEIHGGVGGDRCEAGSGSSDCETASGPAVQRDSSKVAVGLMAPGATPFTQLYLTGSSTVDALTATYTATPAPAVTFTLGTGSAGFDGVDGGCGTPSGAQVTCALPAPLDSILIAGLGGADTLRADGFPDRTAVVIAGGEGGDELIGGTASEDVLVDGPGSGGDGLSALGGDDALLHNGGADSLLGGEGNDLFLSNSVCDENQLDGGPGRDNASWARFGEGVGANVGAGFAGRPGAGALPSCPGGTLDGFTAVEDLEGSNSPDVFYGGPEANQLLGHDGADVYHAEAGADRILANSGDSDAVIDCGGDAGDLALVDRHPQFDDPAPTGCERVVEADPDSFTVGTELPPGTPPPDGGEPPPPRPPVIVDRTPPQTKLGSHPRLLFVGQRRPRRIFLRFSSTERGSGFRCRLDRRPPRSCRSPLGLRVGLGSHVFRVTAIDGAGNADRTPAVFHFVVRARRGT
ncbi:MAG TPA: calcium-binding protein [Solirubrobacterales bacterium]